MLPASEEKARLSKALELVQNAQAHLLENVSPPWSLKEQMEHYSKAVSMLIDAAGIISEMALGGTPGVEEPTSLGFRLTDARSRAGDRSRADDF